MANKKTIAGIVVIGSLAISVPLIAEWEGKRNDPYRDIVGVWTVCYGETNVPMRSYSDEECTAMLRESVSIYQAGVLKCTPTLDGRPYQLAAATSLAYNIGSRAYCRSTAAVRFNQKDFARGCEAITWYNRAGGRTVRGLVNRRKEEYKICMTGL